MSVRLLPLLIPTMLPVSRGAVTYSEPPPRPPAPLAVTRPVLATMKFMPMPRITICPSKEFNSSRFSRLALDTGRPPNEPRGEVRSCVSSSNLVGTATILTQRDTGQKRRRSTGTSQAAPGRAGR